MDLTELLILAATQLALVIACVITGLILYTLKLKAKLRGNDSPAPTEDTTSEDASQEDQSLQPWQYEEFLNEEIEKTKQLYHMFAGHEGEPNVSANMAPKIQAIGIRFQYLLAERNALKASLELKDYWQNLEEPIIKLAKSLTPEQIEPENDIVQEELDMLENALREAESKNSELKHYKTAFLDLQKKWNNACPNQNAIHQQLKAMTAEADNKEALHTQLDGYHQYFTDAGSIFAEENSAQTPPPATGDKNYDQNLNNLHNITLEQSRTIAKLKGEIEKMKNAPGVDIKQIENYTAHTERLEAMLNESSTCIELLETELEASQDTVKGLMERLEEEDTGVQRNDMQMIIEQFTNDSQNMMNTLQMLEEENEQLRSSIEQPASPDELSEAANDTISLSQGSEELKDQLKAKTEDLLNLQTEFNDLEQRYLALYEKNID